MNTILNPGDIRYGICYVSTVNQSAKRIDTDLYLVKFEITKLIITNNNIYCKFREAHLYSYNEIFTEENSESWTVKSMLELTYSTKEECIKEFKKKFPNKKYVDEVFAADKPERYREELFIMTHNNKSKNKTKEKYSACYNDDYEECLDEAIGGTYFGA